MDSKQIENYLNQTHEAISNSKDCPDYMITTVGYLRNQLSNKKMFLRGKTAEIIMDVINNPNIEDARVIEIYSGAYFEC